jgi:hypothetical protein
MARSQEFPVKNFYIVSPSVRIVNTVSGKAGVIENNKLIIDTVYDALAAYDTVSQIVWAKKNLKNVFDDENGLWGEVDVKGEWQLVAKGNINVTDAVLSFPAEFKYGIAPTSFDSMMVFINSSGEIINQQRFDKVIRGKDDEYFVLKNKRWGILSKDLSEITPPVFQTVSEFAGQFAIATLNDTIYLIGKDGSVVKDLPNYLHKNQLCIVDLCDTNAMSYNEGAYEMLEWIENFHLVYHFRNTNVYKELLNKIIIEKWQGACLDFDNRFISRREIVDPVIIADEKFFPSFEIGPAAEYHQSVVDLFYADSLLISFVNCQVHVLVEKRSFPVINISASQYQNYIKVDDSLQSLKISDVMKPNCDKKLESIFITYFNKMDDKDVFESDPITLYNKIKNNVIFSNLGIWFYDVIKDPEFPESDSTETILIPYYAIVDLLKPDSPLNRYFKN